MPQDDYLKRLCPGAYQGESWVHWSLTMDGRATGWLDPRFLYRFREILTHTGFRHRIACLVYCLMPDHVHMLWHGLADDSDQRAATSFFRKQTNLSLKRIGFRWQLQAYDRVLRDTEVEQTELRAIVEYIVRNPERAGLIDHKRFASYAYSGCRLPGFPDLRLFEEDSWPRLWRALSYLKRTDLFHVADSKRG
ncbi:hypothetical protein [Crateriforma spongiae]|uniref:hypothetical protein n=1 Tax=Crateriforma spongiae TaxID=2724528 RepID=UPI0014488645|nr:hypothetical protein [Crateriforma spongiae]